MEMEIPIGFGPNQNLLTAGAAVAREKALAYRVYLHIVLFESCNVYHAILPPHDSFRYSFPLLAAAAFLPNQTFRGQLVPKDQFNFLHGIFKGMDD